jgi:hypothetical protein
VLTLPAPSKLQGCYALQELWPPRQWYALPVSAHVVRFVLQNFRDNNEITMDPIHRAHVLKSPHLATVTGLGLREDEGWGALESQAHSPPPDIRHCTSVIRPSAPASQMETGLCTPTAHSLPMTSSPSCPSSATRRSQPGANIPTSKDQFPHLHTS